VTLLPFRAALFAFALAATAASAQNPYPSQPIKLIDVIVRNQNNEPVATGEAMVEFPRLAKAGQA
jgi:hypothetical protein